MKERIHEFYRIKGFDRAKAAFGRLMEAMTDSWLEEIAKLRRTFLRWKTEILNYFRSGYTNPLTRRIVGQPPVVEI